MRRREGAVPILQGMSFSLSSIRPMGSKSCCFPTMGWGGTTKPGTIRQCVYPLYGWEDSVWDEDEALYGYPSCLLLIYRCEPIVVSQRSVERLEVALLRIHRLDNSTISRFDVVNKPDKESQGVAASVHSSNLLKSL